MLRDDPHSSSWELNHREAIPQSPRQLQSQNYSSLADLNRCQDTENLAKAIARSLRQLLPVMAMLSNPHSACCREGCCDLTTHLLFARDVPPHSLEFYVARQLQYFRSSSPAFAIAALVLLERAHRDREAMLCAAAGSGDAPPQCSLLSPYSIHRLFFGCCVLAAKFLEDQPHSMKYYAQVGGLSVRDAVELESAVLNLLDFDVFVPEDAFYRATLRLHEDTAGAPATALGLERADRAVAMGSAQELDRESVGNTTEGDGDRQIDNCSPAEYADAEPSTGEPNAAEIRGNELMAEDNAQAADPGAAQTDDGPDEPSTPSAEDFSAAPFWGAVLLAISTGVYIRSN